jgi:hypothetical protein
MPVTARGTLTYHYEYLPFGWNFVKVKLYLVRLVAANRALERLLMKEKGFVQRLTFGSGMDLKCLSTRKTNT